MAARPLLLGHRGARTSRSTGENTFAAFDLSLQHGCDGFEFDVRLTGDGRTVVCHDAKVRGVTVSRATCKQLLHLPRLEEVIRRYGPRGFLDIELKVAGLETKVLAALREHSPEQNYVISSFLPEVARELKARSPVVPVGIICDQASQLSGWPKLPVEYVMVHKSLITRRLVQAIHSAGRKIFAWTVNDKVSMLRLASWGVNAIISDNSRLLVRTLGQFDKTAS
jgi:glycerophosphoryl diester phosphodiesterase